MTSTVDSLEASRDITDSDLKLDIRERSEGSETPLLLLGDWLSEDNQKYSEPVIKKDVSLDGKSLKDRKVYIPGSEAVKYNMLFDLNEVERKEFLVNLISEKWDDKKKDLLKFTRLFLIFAF